MSSSGWIGFDLDGTLAEYNGWQGATHIGAPIERTLVKLRQYLDVGQEVRIFTARVAGDAHEAALARHAIEKWCLEHIGLVIPVTNIKDYDMYLLYDDRAISVEENTGRMFGWRTA